MHFTDILAPFGPFWPLLARLFRAAREMGAPGFEELTQRRRGTENTERDGWDVFSVFLCCFISLRGGLLEQRLGDPGHGHARRL